MLKRTRDSVGVPAPTALFASTQHWQSTFQVGSHHIARCFAARGWRVGYVSAPIHAAHLCGFGQDARVRVASWRQGGMVDPGTGIWHHVPFAPVPWAAAPLVRSRGMVRAAWALCRPGLASTLLRAGLGQPDLAYTDHFLHEGLIRASTPRLTIYRRADDVAAIPGAGSDFAARDTEFARRADLTLCPNASAAFELARRGVDTTLVMPNGVNLERFVGHAPLPDAYRNEARPIVVYVGEATHRFDLDLMVKAAKQLVHCRWVIIGPFEGAAAKRLQAAGALVLGPRRHEELAGYLQHARVGVVPFTTTRNVRLIQEVSPLKVLEYAASGLPVVGTEGCQYPRGLPTPLRVVHSPDGFFEAVQSFIESPRPPRPGPTQLAPFAWQTRLDPLFSWLAQQGIASPTAPS